MKILYFTDPHLRANSPGSRLDDFPSAILGKLSWIGSYAFENDIKTIIVGGDWLDRPDVAYTILNKLIIELKIWKKMGITTYTILGNHDLYGYNPMSHERTALSLLLNAELMERLSKEPIEVGNASITGVDAWYGLDKGESYIEDYMNVTGDSSKVKINVLHGFLDDKPWGDIVNMTLIDDIVETDADITLTGHEHVGFGYIIKNKKAFCNPGALGRVTASIGDINQEVKVAVITIHDTEHRFGIELIPLPIHVARPANEVLDRAKIEKEKEHKVKLATFSSMIGDFQIHNTLNVYHALDALAKEDGVSQEVVKGVLKHLERAEEELRKEGNEE